MKKSIVERYEELVPSSIKNTPEFFLSGSGEEEFRGLDKIIDDTLIKSVKIDGQIAKGVVKTGGYYYWDWKFPFRHFMKEKIYFFTDTGVFTHIL